MEEERIQSPDVVVTDHMINALRSTRPWTLFLSVLGFIGLALTVLAGLVMIVAGKFFLEQDNPYYMAFLGIFYIILAAIELVPLIFLFKYSSAIGRFLGSKKDFDLETALTYQKSFWKFMGIFCLIMIIISIIGILAAIAIPLIIKFM